MILIQLLIDILALIAWFIFQLARLAVVLIGIGVLAFFAYLALMLIGGQ